MRPRPIMTGKASITLDKSPVPKRRSPFFELFYRKTGFFHMVPVAGFEPARPYGQGILSPQCLPFHHTGKALYRIHHSKK